MVIRPMSKLGYNIETKVNQTLAKKKKNIVHKYAQRIINLYKLFALSIWKRYALIVQSLESTKDTNLRAWMKLKRTDSITIVLF